MKSENSYYKEYAELAIDKFASKNEESRDILVNAVQDRDVDSVLDIGCGPGQEMLPFAKNRGAFCVGIDIGEELGEIGNEFVERESSGARIVFSRSKGEELPFANESFDVVLCRVALPYMNNRKTIAEVGRVLRPNGVFLLKTHAPSFYFRMLRNRLRSFSFRRISYPLICLAGGSWHIFTGKQLQNGLWRGKEIFQTRRFLERELKKRKMTITGTLSNTNLEAPSFFIVKES